MLATAGAIHLDLYLTGYRHIPTIGTLFLLQVITAFGLAALVCVSRWRLAAIQGSLFALATLVGYLLSLRVGLFGFRAVRTTAGIVAGVVELAAAAVLAASGLRGSLVTTSAYGRQGRAFAGAIALAAVAFTVVLASEASIAPPGHLSTAPGSSTAAELSIRNFMFVPSTLTVAPGQSIRITNDDSVDHTFSSVPGTPAAAAFNSGDIVPGGTVTITAPRLPGSYAYLCQIHNFMTGTLTVR